MKTYILSFLLCFATLSLWSQEADSSFKAENSPILGIGVNSIGFFGDLNDRDYNSPFGGNIGYDFFVIQPVNNFLNLHFHLMYGRIREEERSLQRNLNFSTQVLSGGIQMEYNFDNLLAEYRRVTPFIAAGVEFVQFNPKTDIKGPSGEPYNYWTDGTIRDIPENSPNAENANIIQRDYKYETDMREEGFNSSTDYAERAVSIPLGIGFDMHLTDQIDFRFYSTVHLTFTDYMDGISRSTDTSFLGSKPANGRNDIFLTTGIALSYNFQKIDPADREEFERRKKNESFDYEALGYSEDQDGDDVIDLLDECPETPRGTEVDSLGCPVDTDGDGIPDYLDKEVNSEFPEFANAEGVEMTDQMIYESYLRYIDSTLELTEIVERQFSGSNTRKRSFKYRVQVGSYAIGETPSDMSNLLSLSDLGKLDQEGKTIYTAGKFNSLAQANSRKAELIKAGYADAIVLERNSRGLYVPAVSGGIATEEATAPTTPLTEVDPNKVVFRVQLGAFKNKPTSDKYNEIPNLFVEQAGGYYRYMSGSFDTFEQAAAHKVKMSVQGYKGAFVVAFKGGKRVTLKSVGVQPISSDPIIGQ